MLLRTEGKELCEHTLIHTVMGWYWNITVHRESALCKNKREAIKDRADSNIVSSMHDFLFSTNTKHNYTFNNRVT